MTSKIVQVRIDSELKNKSEEVLSKIGLNFSDAVRIFLNQVVNDQGLPFRPSIDSDQDCK